eukprot:g8213.t1
MARSQEQIEEEDKEPPEPPAAPLAIFGGICKGYGIFAEILKDFLEGVDTFAGRYLAFFSILYIAFNQQTLKTNALDALIAAAKTEPKTEAREEPKKPPMPPMPKAVKMETVKTEPQVKAEDDTEEEEEDPLMGAALKAQRVKEELE